MKRRLRSWRRAVAILAEIARTLSRHPTFLARSVWSVIPASTLSDRPGSSHAASALSDQAWRTSGVGTKREIKMSNDFRPPKGFCLR